MNYLLEKDSTSLKNAIFYLLAHLVGAATFIVVTVILIPNLGNLLGKIILYTLCIGLAVTFTVFSGYLIWYIFAYIFTIKKVITVFKKEEYLLLTLSKKNKIKVERSQIDFVSAKQLWSPIKSVNANKVIINLKDKTKYTFYFLEDPGQAKGLINSVIKGQDFKYDPQ